MPEYPFKLQKGGGWRTRYLSQIFATHINSQNRSMDVYEFGAGAGNSIIEILRALPDCRNVFGFDSFEGLPKEQKDIPIHSSWEEGCINMQESLTRELGDKGPKTPVEAMEQIADYIDDSRVHLFQGWFEDVLKDWLIKGFDMGEAVFVDVDCDLYISAIQSLDFIFRNKLVVPEVTLIAYDDWGGTAEGEGGESLAHLEICEKYNVKADLIFNIGARPNIHRIYKVMEYNA